MFVASIPAAARAVDELLEREAFPHGPEQDLSRARRPNSEACPPARSRRAISSAVAASSTHPSAEALSHVLRGGSGRLPYRRRERQQGFPGRGRSDEIDHARPFSSRFTTALIIRQTLPSPRWEFTTGRPSLARIVEVWAPPW